MFLLLYFICICYKVHYFHFYILKDLNGGICISKEVMRNKLEYCSSCFLFFNEGFNILLKGPLSKMQAKLKDAQLENQENYYTSMVNLDICYIRLTCHVFQQSIGYLGLYLLIHVNFRIGQSSCTKIWRFYCNYIEYHLFEGRFYIFTILTLFYFRPSLNYLSLMFHYFLQVGLMHIIRFAPR